MTLQETAGNPRQTGDQLERVDVDAVNARHKRPLYRARVKIFPKKTDGTFRRLKWIIMAATLAVYYITPWIRWDRGPDAPDQAVLVDLAHRRFFFGPIEIWPQEFYYVAGLLIMAGIGLFLITSTVGRAWCGYTCPQTVWVDLFVAVERWVEGDRNARIKLDKGSWSLEKLRKRVTLNVLWLLMALLTGGAWIFYFADAPTLLGNFVTGEAPFVAYATVGVLTAFTFAFGGYMREQVCTYMCPWPRIQAAMLDENSLTVTYNDWRGEPRERNKKARAAGLAAFTAGEATKKPGDCVDCNLCVAVCPMGIDIRDGQQLECITCALCIDACNSVMDKVGLPKWLISYATLKDYDANKAGEHAPTRLGSFIRPRTILYFAVWSLIGLGMLYVLLNRDRLHLDVLHDRNPLYVMESDGWIRNGFTVRVLNMMVKPRTFDLTIDGFSGGAGMWLAGETGFPRRRLRLDVPADKAGSYKIYVKVPPVLLKGERTPFRFVIKDRNGPEQATYDAIINAPKN